MVRITFHKRIFRVPTLNDLYYTLVGNTQLQPEYTSQWDAGADYRGKVKFGFCDVMAA